MLQGRGSFLPVVHNEEGRALCQTNRSSIFITSNSFTGSFPWGNEAEKRKSSYIRHSTDVRCKSRLPGLVPLILKYLLKGLKGTIILLHLQKGRRKWPKLENCFQRLNVHCDREGYTQGEWFYQFHAYLRGFCLQRTKLQVLSSV